MQERLYLSDSSGASLHDSRPIGNRRGSVRSAREKRLTLNTLADFSGVSRAHLFNVLSGSTSVSLDWIAKLATALELEPWELLVSRRSSGRSVQR